MPMRIVGEGMAMPEDEAMPPVAVTEATVAGVVESRAEKAVPDEVPMAEAMVANEAMAMTHEAGMAEAMSAAMESHSAAAEVTATTAASAEVPAAATTTAATSAELVVVGRLRLHCIDQPRLFAGGDRNRACCARRRQ
jgi:hypothetical protein